MRGKTTVWRLQATNKRNFTRENLDMAKKGKPLEKSRISFNRSTIQHHKYYVKTRISKTQQSSRCRLWSDRDEMINHIISECSKLTQKEYKTKHSWVGKVIHWELCKKFKFDNTSKWYMHTILWDFEIQTDPLILARRPHLMIANNKIEKPIELWTLPFRLITG